MDRPCKCGSWACSPLELTVKQSGVAVGRVEQKWTPYCPNVCSNNCLRCIYEDRVLEKDSSTGAERHVFTIRSSLCCCGRVNNCCGASCCKDTLVLDILDKDGNEVSAWSTQIRLFIKPH